MNQKTVCILAAGQGSRMGDFLSTINKALLPYKGQAILSHIFSKFSADTQFVVAIGHLGQQIVDYVEIAHPDLHVKFVKVDPYTGPKSGPGYSLLCCKHLLTSEFMLICADTLWGAPDKNYNTKNSWLALSQFDHKETSRYCLAEIKNGQICNILDKPKEINPEKSYLAFTGVFFIKNPKEFFVHLQNNTKIHNEHQLSNGFTPLIAANQMYFEEMTEWLDFGTQENYEKICHDEPQFVFQKRGEFIFFVNNQIIKFFNDPISINNRVYRQSQLNDCTPRILRQKNNFYSYHKKEGESFYKHLSPETFKKFLLFIDKHLWTEIKCENSHELGHKFYFEKTKNRMQQYFLSLAKYPEIPLKAEDLPIKWEELNNFAPVIFHGDLQLDNIIYNKEEQQFTLIDWRQDFANSTQCGDIHYDLAKLLASLKVNFLKLKNTKNIIHQPKIQLTPVENYQNYETLLRSFALKKNIDFNRVEQISALIFLNMAPLHRAPISCCLWHKGLELLSTQSSHKQAEMA